MSEVETYPGSTQPLRSAQRRVEAMAGTEEWKDRRHRIVLTYRGKPTVFYKIGALAAALQRKPATLRDWEDMGYLPRAIRRSVSDDARHGKRRLYTEEEIKGLMELAHEEGLYDKTPGGAFRARVADTTFPQRATHLFQTLKDGGRADQ